MTLNDKTSHHRVVTGAIVAAIVPFLTVELFYSSLYQVMDISSYLVFHNVTEFFSIIVSCSIFGLGWYAYDQNDDRHSLFLSVVFLGIGLMDFMHTLGYSGMPALLTPNSPNKSTQFWIAVRLFSAAAFLASAFVSSGNKNRWLAKIPLITATLTISCAVFIGVTFFPESVPATFIQGVGLTRFKKISEFIIISLLILTSIMYWRRMSRTGDRLITYYLVAFILCIFSELVFAVYKSVFDTYNVLGHIYKIVAFGLIYKGVFVASVRKPYEELNQNRNMLSHIINSIPQSLFWKDRDCIYLGCNQVFARQAGIDTPETIVGKSDFDLPWKGELAEGYQADDRHVMSSSVAKYHFIEKLHNSENKIIWIDTTKVPLTDSSGTVNGVLGIFEDITAHKNAEEENSRLESQLQQAQKMESVGRLAGGVAHDFNNLLSVILGYTELALMRMTPDQPHYAAFIEIKKAAERSADLTRQLLAFARKQTVAPKVIDLNTTVSGMLKMLQRLIGEDIQLAWLPASTLWPVRIDPSQVDQILANLCVNARDAIADIGRVSIETENSIIDANYCAAYTDVLPGEYLRLTVSDNGSGMDKETVSRIFEPFFTTKELGKGTGLGLATVYGIVKQNNGFINVYSEPGQGTAFTIYLPRHTGEAGELLKEGSTIKPSRGNETILLVEDESTILKMTALMLEGQGYSVLAAGSCSEAIRLHKEESSTINQLITDVIMPDMNGRNLLKELQLVSPQLKCLFMSGYTADVIAHHGVLDDGVHFIQKPFSLVDLSVKVRELLDGN